MQLYKIKSEPLVPPRSRLWTKQFHRRQPVKYDTRSDKYDDGCTSRHKFQSSHHFKYQRKYRGVAVGGERWKLSLGAVIQHNLKIICKYHYHKIIEIFPCFVITKNTSRQKNSKCLCPHHFKQKTKINLVWIYRLN